MADKNNNEKRRKLAVDPAVDITASDPLRHIVLSDKTVQLTPTEAFAYLDMPAFRGERDVLDSHVQFLLDEAKRGRFIWEHVIIATARIKGEPTVYRINGQHTCWMRTYLPPSTTAKIRRIDYEVPDQENMRRLYGVFDRNKSRTPGHIVKALLAGTETMDGVWDSSIRSLAAGMKQWLVEKKEDQKRFGPNELAAEIDQRPALFQKVGHFVQKNIKQMHLRKAAVYAAMFATFDKQPARADEFWQPVADGLNLDCNTDPRYKLREFLLTARTDRANFGRDSVTTEDVYRICINAWNKWRKGEKAMAGLRTTDRRYKPS
jgi:hypothetical protein